jgi:hypothetical protein
MKCPKCGGECERDEVDNGVGMQACGPWGCPMCHWYERGVELCGVCGENFSTHDVASEAYVGTICDECDPRMGAS